MSRELAPRKLFLLAALTAVLLSVGALAFAVDGGHGGVGANCRDCHGETVQGFSANIHAKADAYGFAGAGCESCHGGSEAHVQSGDPTAIINPAKIDVEAASALCLDCHARGKGQMYWHGSIHESQQISCVACHRVHGGRDHLLSARSETELCIACHIEVGPDLIKRSKHPMRDTSSSSGEGKMTCSSCHNPHGSRAEKLISANSFNDKCYECHYEKKAPLLWEHSPVKEDCLTCHNAHGSSNDKMLVTKVPRLCQQCHMQGRHQTGALGINSTYAVNRACLNCHSQIHGSNNPSGVVLQR